MTEPIVELSSGTVRGARDEGFVVFKGIPYTASTAGTNRFRPPQPCVPWAGVRDALEFGPIAPQVNDTANITTGPWLASRTFPTEAMSEDCLVLNVWTPGLDDQRRPVMVWLHGGAFTSGFGADPRNWGDRLAVAHDVVVVSLNHRLGLLGHLYLADGGGEDGADSGNAGLLDLVAALRWVREHIAAFGGDPERVMILGVSGGGAKVATLLGVPDAAGLFHRGSMESGSLLRASEPADADDLAARTLRKLGVARSDLHSLQKLSWQQLLAAQEPLLTPGLWLRSGVWGPVVDGRTLPAHPFSPVASELGAAVPILAGTTRDEMTVTLAGQEWYGTLTIEGLHALALPSLGEGTDDMIAAYRRAHPAASPTALAVAMVADRMHMAASTIATRRAEAGHAPSYLWRWDHASQAFDGVLGAFHGMVDSYAFRTVDRNARIDDGARQAELVDTASSTWTAFARTGDPNNDTIPTWPPYRVDRPATMLFTLDCEVRPGALGELAAAWGEVESPFG